MSAVAQAPSLEERLARFLPIRVILRKAEDGSYEGLVENSFSMAWHKHRALIHWSGKAYSILGEHDLDAIADAAASLKHYEPEAEIFDPMSPECPVIFDLASWLDAIAQRPGNKFDKRNAFFERGRTQVVGL